jgi:hypothetical protein
VPIVIEHPFWESWENVICPLRCLLSSKVASLIRIGTYTNPQEFGISVNWRPLSQLFALLNPLQYYFVKVVGDIAATMCYKMFNKTIAENMLIVL